LSRRPLTGSDAALPAALLEPPDALVVGSGLSAVSEESLSGPSATRSSSRGFSADGPGSVIERIDFPSQLMFGRAEIDTYRIDTDTRRTCSIEASSEFIECILHGAGHVSPELEARLFSTGHWLSRASVEAID
jgi:hypothetical protein